MPLQCNNGVKRSGHILMQHPRAHFTYIYGTVSIMKRSRNEAQLKHSLGDTVRDAIAQYKWNDS